MTDCQHKRGDWIKEQGYWLCADCFAKMDSRPKRYGPIQVHGQIYSTDAPASGPQEIIWQAEVAAADGATFNDFLREMAWRFMQETRPQMGRDDAYDMAVAVLKTLGDAYGDPEYDWSLAGAREIADDEMRYWDSDGGASNG